MEQGDERKQADSPGNATHSVRYPGGSLMLELEFSRREGGWARKFPRAAGWPGSSRSRASPPHYRHDAGGPSVMGRRDGSASTIARLRSWTSLSASAETVRPIQVLLGLRLKGQTREGARFPFRCARLLYPWPGSASIPACRRGLCAGFSPAGSWSPHVSRDDCG